MTGTAWETVGWKETAAQARDPDKAKEDIKVFLKEFYKKKKKDPRKHQRVVQSYKRTKDQTNSCRMRAA